MNKQPISVTLRRENLLWLRGRVRATGQRSVSEALDRLIEEVRQLRSGSDARSIEGTARLLASDDQLDNAREEDRLLYAEAVERSARALEPGRETRSGRAVLRG